MLLEARSGDSMAQAAACWCWSYCKWCQETPKYLFTGFPGGIATYPTTPSVIISGHSSNEETTIVKVEQYQRQLLAIGASQC